MCRELHAIVVVHAVVTVIVVVAFILERVPSISAVSGHIQPILVGGSVTDLERPVLGRVPEICWPMLNLNSQAIRL